MAHKILLVDDDIDLIQQYEPFLKQAGYEVETACDGREGFEKFKVFKPDAMLVDLAMEHFDSGFVLCHKVKKTEKGKNTPVIIMTSAGRETGIRLSADTAEETNWIQADDYLEKPISPRDMLQYLSEKVFKK